MSRITKKYFVVTVCCGLLLQGCAPVFLAAGAGAGYLAVDKKAARKVDRFFQDLVKSIQTSSSRIAGSKKGGKHKQGRAPAVHLQETSLQPSTVSKGESITAIIIYGVEGGPSEEGLTVVERKELWFNNKRLAVLQDESVSRENGTWKSRLVFKVPKSASKGTYVVKQVVSFKGKEKRSQKKFTVL